jgi:hypothetical protein
MELFVLLLVVAAVDLALWLGWGTDSRERDNNWHPSTERRTDRLGPAESDLGGRHDHVLAR